MGYVLNKGNSGNIVVGNSTIAEIEKVLSKSNAIGKCSSGVVFIDLILAEDEDGANDTDNYPIHAGILRR